MDLQHAIVVAHKGNCQICDYLAESLPLGCRTQLTESLCCPLVVASINVKVVLRVIISQS